MTTDAIEYEFALTLSGVAELTTRVEDALFDAGCDDGTLSVQNGEATIQFARAGASFADAVLSAVRDVRRAVGVGVDVIRVEGADEDVVQAVNAALALTRQRARNPDLVAHVWAAVG